MQTFGQRLLSLQRDDESLRAFAQRLNLSDTIVRRYLSERGRPRDKTIAWIAKRANVHTNWLATGEGPRDIQPETALSPLRTEREQMRRPIQQVAMVEPDKEDAVALPRLSVEGSGGSGLIPSSEEIEDYLAVSRTYLREVGISPQHAHVLRLSGHSMWPTLMDKDLIIIDVSRNALRDEEVYAVVFGDTVLVKRLMPLWDGSVRIMSDNKNGNYPDSIVPADKRRELRIVGRVGGFLRYF